MEEKSAESKKLLYPEEKISNYPLYFFHIFGKLVSLFVFGVGTILLSIVCFPIGKIIFHPKKRFRYHMRHLVYILFNIFLKFMQVIGVSKITVDKKGFLNSLRSAIVVANHPSYLDSPVMISQLKHTAVIAKASLSKKNIMHAVINELYMPNSLPFEEMRERAKEDLASGNTIILFPEGTRSTLYGQHKFKKGAARLSLASGCPIIPVYIGGTNKKGMRKGDKVLEFNESKRYVFDLHVKEPVYPEEFKDLPEAIAAKRMTEKIEKILSDDDNAAYRY